MQREMAAILRNEELFLSFAMDCTAIVQSSIVARRVRLHHQSKTDPGSGYWPTPKASVLGAP
jgi:hypothetical protein